MMAAGWQFVGFFSLGLLVMQGLLDLQLSMWLESS